MQEIIKSVT